MPVPLPSAALPSVPRYMVWTWLARPLLSDSAAPGTRVIISPRTTLLLASIRSAPCPAASATPSIRTSGTPAKPGWLVPSMSSVAVTMGKGVASAMVRCPAARLKVMVSLAGVAFAMRIAERRVPAAPVSALEVTGIVTASAARLASNTASATTIRQAARGGWGCGKA